jgi:type IV secretory pathway VirB4 component
MMNLAEYRRSNTRLADFLPWAALVDEGIVLNKDGSLTRFMATDRAFARARRKQLQKRKDAG